MLQRTKWLVISSLISVVASCADGRDLFAPYRPQHDEIRSMLAWPPLPTPADVAIVLGCPAEDDGSASLCELCRISRQANGFQPRRRSGDDADRPFRKSETLGEELLQRRVGRPLFRHRAHPHREMGRAIRGRLQAVDCLDRGFRRQPHEKVEAVRPRPVAGGHAQTKSGAIVDQSSSRTK